jgi:nicotinate-nucleotide adenylyltransferase
MGGTFDPIHFGHLRTAWELLALPLDEVRFIPCGQPAHREIPIAKAQQRLDMLKCALESEKKLIADPREIERAGPSYMIDTLKLLKADFNDAKLHLILGMDAFCELDTWKDWQSLSDYASLVVVRRLPFQLPVNANFRGWYSELEKEGKLVFMQDLTQLEVSATKIRKVLQRGESPKYLLPETVLNYIYKNNLYQR